MAVSSCFSLGNQTRNCSFFRTLQDVCSVASIFCLLLVVITIVFYKLYQCFVQRLILYLCLSAIVKTAVNLIRIDQTTDRICIAQAVLSQIFTWSELMWVCCITFYIFMITRERDGKYECKMHCFVWSVSIFMSLVPFFGRVMYGPAGIWCWVKREFVTVRFLVWYGPFFVITLLLMGVYIYLVWYAYCSKRRIDGNDSENEQNRKIMQQEVKLLWLYPVISVVLEIPLLIYRVEDALYPKEPPSFVLLVLSTLVISLSGPFNALTFAMTEETLRVNCSVAFVRSIFCRCCDGEKFRIRNGYSVIDDCSGDLSSDPNYQTYNKT